MSILDRFRLDGQVAVVTGSGRGIGEGIAVGLAEAGAAVVVAARRTNEIEAVAEKILPSLAVRSDSCLDLPGCQRRVECTLPDPREEL